MEVIDVRIKRIDLEDAVSNSVYQRMATERREVAKDRRSRGEEEAKKIRAIAEREREILLAEATRESQRTRGEGDGSATEIYAKAYMRDPDFYRFYRSLNAYSASFRSKSDVLLLQPDADSSTSSRTRKAAATADRDVGRSARRGRAPARAGRHRALSQPILGSPAAWSASTRWVTTRCGPRVSRAWWRGSYSST